MFGKNRWAVATLCLAKIIGLLEIVYPAFYSPLPLERGEGVRLRGQGGEAIWRGGKGVRLQVFLPVMLLSAIRSPDACFV